MIVPQSLTNQETVTSTIEENLRDTDKYVSMVEILSEIVAKKLSDRPEDAVPKSFQHFVSRQRLTEK